MEPDRTIRVEIAYALPEMQEIVALELPAGATVKDAIFLSGIAARHSEIPATPAVGIHGRRVPLNIILRAGDRIEIYRPLLADPKQARRRRAAAGS
jgi:putative ubiquitin-RnfH superfamily antitoxin RatB of RatAB toxin-antitoxin module